MDKSKGPLIVELIAVAVVLVFTWVVVYILELEQYWIIVPVLLVIIVLILLDRIRRLLQRIHDNPYRSLSLFLIVVSVGLLIFLAIQLLGVRSQMNQHVVATTGLLIKLDTCGVYNVPEALSTGRIEALGKFELPDDECIRPLDSLLNFTWVGFSFTVNGQGSRLEDESAGSFVTFYDEPVAIRDNPVLLFSVRGEGDFLDMKVRLVLDNPALPSDSRGKEVVILESPPLSELGVIVREDWQTVRLGLAEFHTMHIRRKRTDLNLSTLNKLVFTIDNDVADTLLEELAAGQPGTEPVISGQLFVRDIVFTWR